MKIFTALTTFALVQGTSCLKFFNSTNQLPSNMTDSCKDALTSDIECSPRLITASNVMKRLEHNTTILEEYCNDQCTKSLKVMRTPLCPLLEATYSRGPATDNSMATHRTGTPMFMLAVVTPAMTLASAPS